MPNINDYGLPFTSQDGDRKYSALEWREYFSRLIHNGLIQNAANECQVKPQAVPNKTVYVDTGVVFINGAMRVLDAPVTLAVAENTSGNPRIDRVVARLDEADRTIEFAVKQGTPAGSPVAPALTKTEGVYELGLADLTLANGYSTITSGAISDKRWDVSLCGASSMTIGVIPPSGMEAETVTLSAAVASLFNLTGSDENVDKALETIHGMLGALGIVVGSYTGDGGAYVEGALRLINLGFQPKAVFVISTKGPSLYSGSLHLMLSGLAVTGSPARYDASIVSLECVANGFNTRNYYTQALNRTGYVYNYIAFK